MAHEATNWAYKLDLPMTQKFILIALADRADEEFSCYPGQKTIAKMTGTSVSTVHRALKSLEDLGLIVRKQRRREDGYRTSDRYFLSVGKSPVNMEHETNENDSHMSESTTSPVNDDKSHRSPVTEQESSVKNHQLTTSSKQAPGKPDAAMESATQIAKSAYDNTQGALNFHGTRTVAKWAIQSKQADPAKVESAIAAIYNAGRPVTKVTVGQYLDGVTGRSGKPSPTDRVRETLELGERLQQEQDALEQRSQGMIEGMA